MARRAAGSPADRRNYWIGIGLGMIPVVVLWIAVGLAAGSNGTSSSAAGSVATTGLILYAASIVAAIIALTIVRSRRLGYGLLTMVFVGPVVWSIGCVVILSSGQ
jgi:uncharacterized membrane protein YhaH (DUF805 family)